MFNKIVNKINIDFKVTRFESITLKSSYVVNSQTSNDIANTGSSMRPLELPYLHLLLSYSKVQDRENLYWSYLTNGDT